MNLQKFTWLQQQVVIINLIKLSPHREIARHLQELYEGIKPDGMTQEEYEEIVIKRCKDYVSNKDRKPYHQIKKGRDIHRDGDIEDLKYMLKVSFDWLDRGFRDEVKQIEYADTYSLVEKTYKLMGEIYKLLSGEELTDGDEIEDETDDEIKDDRTFWEFWGDTEWERILQERKESGNSLKDSAPVEQAVDSLPVQNSGAISLT